MHIIFDKNGFITAASWGGILEKGVEVEDFEFTETIHAYRYNDGEIILDEERLELLKQEEQVYVEIEELQKFLNETQAIITQAFEEEILGIDSNKETITEIVQKRRQAKIRIQEIQEAITNESSE